MPLNTMPVHDHLLQAAPAQVSPEQAGAIASECFGLHGAIQRLAGERDLNFQIGAADGGSRLLKLSHPLEDPQVVDFQNQALLRVQRADPSLPVQRVYPAADGSYQVWVEVDGQRMLARLFSFVDGLPLHRVGERSPALRRNLGDALARLDRALQGFEHPASGHALLWDMQQAARLRPLLQHIDDLAQRALVERFLDAFEEHALPRLPTLRAQVIHNDLNPHNVIVDAQHPEQLRNILDFGDMVRAPLVNDLGVAAAYQLGSGADALAPALEFIAAYHRRNPLQPAEQEILADLMATRLVMTLSITAWRASLHPENRDYILRNVHQAWSSLQGLAGLTRSEAQARIAAACQEESPA
ncbi:phosphotransferase [Pseudomonas panipatensis]|uniref:Hydroxylysine kinase n=1 Tax=Pseudomonas panipatensis TaxID=428992 RepID=A0A1G8BSY5_9PSED|nr:phosphotransferase [Pseudomonas panipatensis]SDH36386.1 Ser/Thr protein kinase RdoA involved in Cpx stress response, MazF antagonist [Pseudomonas panipatensis]SMP71835.1 Ser/Thr protein kinase RdoA involved in Cpx stress response, MazF antagonist [Pseudomonas panipatensis]